MYRDRFRQATDQSERMTVIIEEGPGAMDTREDAFPAVGLVSTTSGSMPIDLARLRSLEQWVSDFGRPDWWRGFFHRAEARVYCSGRHTSAASSSRNFRWLEHYPVAHRPGRLACVSNTKPRARRVRLHEASGASRPVAIVLREGADVSPMAPGGRRSEEAG